MTRLAAIDAGSNGIRCHVVEVGPGGEVRVLESVRAPVRLGAQVFHTGRIGPAGAEEAVEAFRLFRRLLDTHQVEHVRAVATSATREATDGEALLERLREATGITVEVIDGAQESHLVRRAIASALDIGSGRTAAVDVGGGSVEVLVMQDGDAVRSESFDMGAVRLLEALTGPADPAGEDFYSLLTEYVEAVRARVRTAMGEEPVEFLAATGGSIVSLADLAGKEVSGPPVLVPGVRAIPLGRLRDWIGQLAARSFRQRVDEYGLPEHRADVILPAGVVYLKIAEIFGVEQILVPDVGLKDGLVLDMVDDLTRRGMVEGHRREVRAAALGLGRRYALDELHAERVAELALSIYDQTTDLHGLGDEERTLLEASALLHDVGVYLSVSRHHKHSHYIISQSDLVGLDRRQRDVVANVARYHRKSHPSRRHDHFASLPTADRSLVRKLAALLRAADVLDREHRQNVTRVRVLHGDGRVVLEVEGEGDLLLEQWASKQKFGLFEDVFGLPLVLERAC